MDETEQPTLKEILAKIQQIDRLDDHIKAQIAAGAPSRNTKILMRRMHVLSQEVQTALQGTYPRGEDFTVVEVAVKAMHKKLFGHI